MDSKKEQIVRIALKRFSHYGFNKTSMNEIAMDLNITKANLYYYYPDKNALIKDVLDYITGMLIQEELAQVDAYQGNVVPVLHKMLEIRAHYLREYYVLHINESIEWIKGQGIATLLMEMHQKNIEIVMQLFTKAIAYGELIMADVQQSAISFVEIFRGLSLIKSVDDIVSGMPNSNKVDEILASQKAAIDFIFSNKLNNINKKKIII